MTRPVTHWSILIFAMVFPGVMAWVYFVALAKPPTGSTADVTPATVQSYAVMISYFLAKAVQTGLPLGWVWCFERHRLKLTAPSFRGLGLALGFGIAVAAGLLTLYHGVLRGGSILEATPGLVREKVSSFHAATPARYLLLAVFIAVVHSLMEEYYWRWFVFGELQRYLAVVPAILLSSLAFMIHHVVVLNAYLPDEFWLAAIPFSLCVAAGGGAWAWLYHRTGTIYSSWLSHLLVDAAILVVGYDMIFGF